MVPLTSSKDDERLSVEQKKSSAAEEAVIEEFLKLTKDEL